MSIKMVSTILFYNLFHIGDVWLTKGILKTIIDQNPTKTFEFLIRKGGAFFSDMPQLRIHYVDSYGIPSSISNERTTYAYMNDDMIAINTWIGAISCNGNSCEDIECIFEKVQECLKTQIDRANMDGAELIYEPAHSSELIPRMPLLDVPKWDLWKKQNKKPCILYHNFIPLSCQPLDIKNHDTVIIELSKLLPDTIILVAQHMNRPCPEIPNIIDCVDKFDLDESPACTNLVQLAKILSDCNWSINFDIGACMTYANTELMSSTCKIIIPSSYKCHRFYNRIRMNFSVSDEVYKKHVVPVAINNDLVHSIINIIKGGVPKT